MTMGFQQVSASLQDLARGQAHMLTMMESGRAENRERPEMNVEAATQMAARMAQETYDMAVDDEVSSPESPSWDRVMNPNSQDLPSSSHQ